MQIDGSTKVLGIIGDPVAHSLSPVMQNAAIAAAGINAVYVPFHISPERLGEAVTAIRAQRMVGVNVTVPHKETVIPFLDDIDPVARLIGAVNTIVNQNEKLVGFNTDGLGLIRSLEDDLSFIPSGKSAVILGAGGAARAAIVALAQAGTVSLTIVNRTCAKADQLVAEFSGHFPDSEIAAAPLDGAGVVSILGGTDLLVNTTTVGLHGDNFDVPLIEKLRPGAVFFDMVYAPELTPMQMTAEEWGVPFADGRGMLAGQGEESFLLWFGMEPMAEIMKLQVKK